MSKVFKVMGEELLVSDQREEQVKIRERFFQATKKSRENLRQKLVTLCNVFDENEREKRVLFGSFYTSSKSDFDDYTSIPILKISSMVIKLISDEIDEFSKTWALSVLSDQGLFHIDMKVFSIDQDLNIGERIELYDDIRRLIFQKDKFLEQCINKIIKSYFYKIFDQVRDIIQAEDAIIYDYVSEDDEKKAVEILKNIANIPDEHLGKALVKALDLDPFNADIYAIIGVYMDENLAIEMSNIAKYFSMDHKVFRTVIDDFSEMNKKYLQRVNKDNIDNMEKTYSVSVHYIKTVCRVYDVDPERYIEKLEKKYLNKKQSIVEQ